MQTAQDTPQNYACVDITASECQCVRMQTKHDSYNDLLTSGQAAILVSVSIDTLRRWEKAGRIAALRTPTGHRRFRRGDVERLLSGESNSTAAAMGGAA